MLSNTFSYFGQDFGLSIRYSVESVTSLMIFMKPMSEEVNLLFLKLDRLWTALQPLKLQSEEASQLSINQKDENAKFLALYQADYENALHQFKCLYSHFIFMALFHHCSKFKYPLFMNFANLFESTNALAFLSLETKLNDNHLDLNVKWNFDSPPNNLTASRIQLNSLSTSIDWSKTLDPIKRLENVLKFFIKWILKQTGTSFNGLKLIEQDFYLDKNESKS